MRLLVPLVAILALAAGCLDGPTRVSSISPTCPNWTEGLNSPSVTTVMNPRDPTTWQSVDFSAGNATKPGTPLTSGDTETTNDGRTLTQDRILLDFNWETRDGKTTARYVYVMGGDLSLRFTHASGGPEGGRVLPFSLIGLPDGYDAKGDLLLFSEFHFVDRLASNFTVHVLLDKQDGSPDPSGAYAHWSYTPSVANPQRPGYSYRAVGLYDHCEGK